MLSFLSPCVAPVVPGYLSFVSGAAIGPSPGEPRQVERVAIASVLFVLGFAAVFVTLGATAGAVGAILAEHRSTLNRLSGAVMLAMGLFVLGVVRIGPLLRERRVHLIDRTYGPIGTVLVGMAFGFGWTPCIGPILASILLYAGATETAQAGAILLLMYSLGLGLPFILAALGISQAVVSLPMGRHWLPALNRVSGVALLVLGALFLTNQAHVIGYLNGATMVLFERFVH